MERELIVSPNAKSDYSILGEAVAELRQTLPLATKPLEKIDIIKTMISGIDKRINLRIQERKDTLASIEIDEYNCRTGKSFKIRNLELKKFDETTD